MQSATGQDSAARIGEISGQLEQAKLELREAETARDAAKAQLAGSQTQTAGLTTQSLLQESALAVSTPEIDARIEAQKRNLDNLLQRYTERHPDIIGTRRLLKDLEEQKVKEVQALRMAAMNMPPPTARAQQTSPAFQEISRVLAASEIQVASLRARVGRVRLAPRRRRGPISRPRRSSMPRPRSSTATMRSTRRTTKT